MIKLPQLLQVALHLLKVIQQRKLLQIKLKKLLKRKMRLKKTLKTTTKKVAMMNSKDIEAKIFDVGQGVHAIKCLIYTVILF
jgi:hypothetical protein